MDFLLIVCFLIGASMLSVALHIERASNRKYVKLVAELDKKLQQKMSSEKEIYRLNYENCYLRFQNDMLKSSIDKMGSKSAAVSEDIKEAVKYAMIHSHPDNGGTPEDFTKFRKVYEELKTK